MQVCNYCGRNLRNHYSHCPGCNSTDFSFKPDSNEAYIINTPPEGGYKLDKDTYRQFTHEGQMVKTLGASLIVMSFFAGVFLFIFPLNPLFILLCVALFIVGILIMIKGVNDEKANRNAIERLNKLSTTGILVKNLPCTKTRTTKGIDQYQYDIIHVVYVTPDGRQLQLASSPRSSFNLFEDGKADLLIDPNDYSNYFIDTEIY